MRHWKIATVLVALVFISGCATPDRPDWLKENLTFDGYSAVVKVAPRDGATKEEFKTDYAQCADMANGVTASTYPGEGPNDGRRGVNTVVGAGVGQTVGTTGAFALQAADTAGGMLAIGAGVGAVGAVIGWAITGECDTERACQVWERTMRACLTSPPYNHKLVSD